MREYYFGTLLFFRRVNEMSITKISKGKYTGCFRVRIQPKDLTTGKQISLPSKVADTLVEAKH